MIVEFVLKPVHHISDEGYCVAFPFEERNNKVNFSFQ